MNSDFMFHKVEIERCRKDPLYFFNKYVKISTPIKGEILFDTRDYQDDCVRDFMNHKLNVVLKSRQLGLSTTAAAYALWKVIFYSNMKVSIASPSLKFFTCFIRRCQDMLKSLPAWIVPGVDSSLRLRAINISNGSSIRYFNTECQRGYYPDLLIGDELAYAEDPTLMEEILRCGDQIILISSLSDSKYSSRYSDRFFKLYNKARKKENNFNPIFLPWTVGSESYKQAFQMRAEFMSPREISYEYDCKPYEGRVVKFAKFRMTSYRL